MVLVLVFGLFGSGFVMGVMLMSTAPNSLRILKDTKRYNSEAASHARGSPPPLYRTLPISQFDLLLVAAQQTRHTYINLMNEPILHSGNLPIIILTDTSAGLQIQMHYTVH